MGSERTVRAVRIENEIELRAPRDKAFEAFLEQDKWYPHYYDEARMKGVVYERFVGGRAYEDWGDGAGMLYGTIAYFDAPKALCLLGHLRGGVSLEQWFVFDERGDVTVLKQSLVAFGELSDEDAEGIQMHGDLAKVQDKLKAWVEEGKARA